MTPVRKLARSLGLGRLYYLAVHAPVAALARSAREGGPVEQWITNRGRRAMQAAACHLPGLPVTPPSAPAVTYLTGSRFWFQTAFCHWSLRRYLQLPVRLVLVDDGTLTEPIANEARRLFPGVEIRTPHQIDTQLEKVLPAAHYPSLRVRRRQYVHLRKLTDTHIFTSGWNAVLDSDMLCFRTPREFEDWIASPDRPIHMTDVQNAYGYPADVLQNLVHRPIPDRINVGILGLQAETIPWRNLEEWCRELVGSHGTSYYLEQALSALLLSGGSSRRLDPDAYRVMPSLTEARDPVAVFHHYVAESKAGYFRHAWKRILKDASIAGDRHAPQDYSR